MASALLSLVAAFVRVVVGEGAAIVLVLVAALVLLVGVLWSGWLGVSALRGR